MFTLYPGFNVDVWMLELTLPKDVVLTAELLHKMSALKECFDGRFYGSVSMLCVAFGTASDDKNWVMLSRRDDLMVSLNAVKSKVDFWCLKTAPNSKI